MTDLFSRLLQRSRGEDLPSPVLPSRFAPSLDAAGPWAERGEFVVARRDEPGARIPPVVSRPPLPDAIEAESGRFANNPRLDRVGDAIDTIPPPWHEPDRLPTVVETRSTEPATLDLAAIIAAALRQLPAQSSAPPERESAVGVRLLQDDDTPQERPIVRPTPAIDRLPRPLAPPVTASPPEQPPPPAPGAINVRIGRIEVTVPPPNTPKPPAATRLPRSTAPALPLRDYLARRGRR